MNNTIKELVLSCGADVCGIANIDRFDNAPDGFSPRDIWNGCKEDTLTARGLISIKHTAVLCGLGTIGKSSLLLNPQFGSLLTIGVILTDLPLESDPLCPNVCIEGCTLCIDSCPVHAIEKGTVNQKSCRQNSYGKTKRGFDTVDCNLCRTVCPRRFGIK